MEDSMLMEILKKMQKKYQCISEIERITRDLLDSISRNDRTSIQILLGMRKEEMDQADLCDHDIECLISALSTLESDKIRSWMKGLTEWEIEGAIAQKIVERGSSILTILERTVLMDRQINKKMAGNESFYS